MNEKLLEQKAEEKFKTKPLGYEMKSELDIYTDGYIDGATEETKLLVEENKKLRNCVNCGNWIHKDDCYVCSKGLFRQFCFGKDCEQWT